MEPRVSVNDYSLIKVSAKVTFNNTILDEGLTLKSSEYVRVLVHNLLSSVTPGIDKSMTHTVPSGRFTCTLDPLKPHNSLA